MIDNTVLDAYPFRTTPFLLAGIKHQWEGRTTGGRVLVETEGRAYAGEVEPTTNCFEARTDRAPVGAFVDREAAMFALASAVAERHAAYVRRMEEFDARRAERAAAE